MEKDPKDITWTQHLKKFIEPLYNNRCTQCFKRCIEHLYNCYNTSIVYNIILFSVLILLSIVGVLVFKFNLKDTATLFVLFITAIISFMLMLEQHRVAEAQEKSNTEQRKSNIEQRYNYAINQIESKREGVVRIGFQNLYELALEEQSDDKRKRICTVFCNYLQTESRVGRMGHSHENISKDTVQFILNLLIRKNDSTEIPFLSNWLDLSNVDFQGADLKNADLRQAQLQNANLNGAQLQGANLQGSQFQWAKLGHAQFQGAYLEKAQLQGANLNGAQLQGANLQGAQLQGANLWRAQLQGANLKKAQLQGASLIRAQIQGADLKEAEFQGADLKEAQLQGADLKEAEFQGVDLQEAQLQEADLEDAKFQGAYLSKAQFQEAEFKDTDFSGAYTVSNTSISGQTNLERAVARLIARSDQPTDLKNVIFGGGVKPDDLPDFEKKRKVFEKVLIDIKYNINDGFKEKMDKVENILKQNTGKTEDYAIPSNKVITGKYPKADADKVIEDLKRIINDLSA